MQRLNEKLIVFVGLANIAIIGGPMDVKQASHFVNKLSHDTKSI